MRANTIVNHRLGMESGGKRKAMNYSRRLILLLGAGIMSCSLAACDLTLSSRDCEGGIGVSHKIPDTTLVAGRDTMYFAIQGSEPVFVHTAGKPMSYHVSLSGTRYIRVDLSNHEILEYRVVAKQAGQAGITIEASDDCLMHPTVFGFEIEIIE